MGLSQKQINNVSRIKANKKRYEKQRVIAASDMFAKFLGNVVTKVNNGDISNLSQLANEANSIHNEFTTVINNIDSEAKKGESE